MLYYVPYALLCVSFSRCFCSSLQGRKARLKVTRSATAAQNRYTRGSPGSSYSSYSNSTGMNRLSNGASSGVAGEEYSNGSFEEL